MDKLYDKDPVRPLRTIARDIRHHWPNVWFGAVPYLRAMAHLEGITDKYGSDDAKSIVLYFLSNATTWRGEHARRIKAELKKLAGIDKLRQPFPHTREVVRNER